MIIGLFCQSQIYMRNWVCDSCKNLRKLIYQHFFFFRTKLFIVQFIVRVAPNVCEDNFARVHIDVVCVCIFWAVSISCVSPSLCLTCARARALSLSLSFSFALSFFLSLSLSFSPSIFLHLSPSQLSPSLFLSFSYSLFLSLCHTHTLFLLFFFPLSLPLSLSHTHTLSDIGKDNFARVISTHNKWGEGGSHLLGALQPICVHRPTMRSIGLAQANTDYTGNQYPQIIIKERK